MILVRVRLLRPDVRAGRAARGPRRRRAGLPGWNTKQFTFERIDADRVRLQREVEIEGEAGTANAGQKFFADDLQMNIKTGELSASGNVVFMTPTARISADSVVFNTKTGVGTFYTASGIAQLGERGERNRSMFGTLEPDVYFYGETIEKIGPDKYRITRAASRPACSRRRAGRSSAAAPRSTSTTTSILRNAVVGSRTCRSSTCRCSTTRSRTTTAPPASCCRRTARRWLPGQSISNAFFWAINRSQDVTLFHDWMFSRGNGLGAEYRYVLGPQAQGDFRVLLARREGSGHQRRHAAGAAEQDRCAATSARTCRSACRRAAASTTSPTSRVQQTYNHNIYNASNGTRSYQRRRLRVVAQPVGQRHVRAHRVVPRPDQFHRQRPRARRSPRR